LNEALNTANFESSSLVMFSRTRRLYNVQYCISHD